jgi:hypothetical protein
VRKQDKSVGGVQADANHVEFRHKLIGYRVGREEFWIQEFEGVEEEGGCAASLCPSTFSQEELSHFPSGANALQPLGFN